MSERREYWLTWDSLGVRNINDKPFDSGELELIHVREVLPEDDYFEALRQGELLIQKMEKRHAALIEAARKVVDKAFKDEMDQSCIDDNGQTIDALRKALEAESD